MMRYFDQLDIRKTGEREWTLLSDFRFESDSYRGVFLAPRGMRTNFASIPRIAWVLFPPIGNYDEAAVIHDGAYQDNLLTMGGEKIHAVKAVADKLFLEALQCETNRKSKVGPRLAKFMYFAVKYFGNKQES